MQISAFRIMDVHLDGGRHMVSEGLQLQYLAVLRTPNDDQYVGNRRGPQPSHHQATMRSHSTTEPADQRNRQTSNQPDIIVLHRRVPEGSKQMLLP